MKKIELFPGLCVYSNVSRDPEKVYSKLKNSELPWTEALIAESRYREHKEKSLKEIRDAEVVPIYMSQREGVRLEVSELAEIFNQIFSDVELDFISYYGVDVAEKEDPYQLIRYSSGQFIVPHVDSTEEFPRKITMIYYPNDDYIGGELYFPKIDIKLKPRGNSVVIFFSDSELFLHSSEKIIDGTKYAVVGLWK